MDVGVPEGHLAHGPSGELGHAAREAELDLEIAAQPFGACGPVRRHGVISATPAPPSSSPQATRRASGLMARALIAGPFSAFSGISRSPVTSAAQTRPSS